MLTVPTCKQHLVNLVTATVVCERLALPGPLVTARPAITGVVLKRKLLHRGRHALRPPKDSAKGLRRLRRFAMGVC